MSNIKKGDYIESQSKNRDGSFTSPCKVTAIGKDTFSFTTKEGAVKAKQVTLPNSRLKDFTTVAAPEKVVVPVHCTKAGKCANVKCAADLCYHDKRS